MQAAFFLREALRGLRRSSAPALAALLTVLLTALVLGVFIPIVQATTGTANEVRSRVVADVYVKDSATQAQQSELKRELEATEGVKSVEYISKSEALANAKEKNPGAFDAGAELLGANPLPASFRVTPDDPDGLEGIVAALQPGGQASLRGHRRGAQPRGGHEQDPLGHRAGQGPHRRTGRPAALRVHRAHRQHDPPVGVRPPA